MGTKRQISELLSVPETDHDVDWLKDSLEIAVQLEFTTIPPYLTAFWSIVNKSDPVARAIRNIFKDEMLHFGIACNLLAGIGGSPVINSADVVPKYPTSLPGGVAESLIIPLQRLSLDAADLFMKIERPEFEPLALEVAPATIGEFYTRIQSAFETVQPAFTQERQVEGDLGLTKINSSAEARSAIDKVKLQGEGSKIAPDGTSELAHYYRFGEIFHQRRIQKDQAGKWHFDGPAFPLPEVFPMAEIPKGGYKESEVSPETWQLLEGFDRGYTDMLGLLQKTWENADPGSLDAAIEAMRDLRTPAVALMGIPRSSGTGNYGPCFRLAT